MLFTAENRSTTQGRPKSRFLVLMLIGCASTASLLYAVHSSIQLQPAATLAGETPVETTGALDDLQRHLARLLQPNSTAAPTSTSAATNATAPANATTAPTNATAVSISGTAAPTNATVEPQRSFSMPTRALFRAQFKEPRDFVFDMQNTSPTTTADGTINTANAGQLNSLYGEGIVSNQ
jgi:hypothetical protein